MIKRNTLAILFLLLAASFSAQTFEVRGVIVDALAGYPLNFANIRVAESNIGTAANQNGEYSLKLNAGNYELIASFIGYYSDTLRLNVNGNLTVNFALNPASIELGEVTVIPGVNPAIAIIESTIERKHERNSLLNSYIFDAYTKGKIFSTEDITSDGGSVGIGLGLPDSAELKITGIVENQSKGYFLHPDYYKEEIVARKQSSNFPPTVNILTGGRIIQNFYSDDIQFFGNELLSPIADNALNYYYFYLEDTLAIDNKKVFQIYFSTIDVNDPGFYGRIFILDKDYALLKVDIDLNAAANPGGIFSIVNIFQQFVPYANNIYMPIDYRIFVEGNYLGLVRFGFELNSILYNYEINPGLTVEDFGMTVLQVRPDADKKDSTYWNSVQTIPTTILENEAYQRIDSLESIEKTFWDKFSFLASTLDLTDNLFISGPIGLYHFNHVEGHSIDFTFGFKNLFEDRLDSKLDLSYGFSDKKLKKEFSVDYLLGDFRTTELSLSVFDRTNILFQSSDNYNSFTSTITSLLGKYDFRDYYHSSGISFEAKGDVLSILELSFGFLNRTDKSLTGKSDYSFFNKDKSYAANRSIYDTKINAVEIGFEIDFRRFIEDGKFRRRINQQSSNISFAGSALLSSNSILKSKMDFEIYNFDVRTRIKSFASTTFNINLNSTFSNGAIPLQMMNALPGNLEISGKSGSFRTLKIGEVYGDQIITSFFQYNFGSELWRFLNLPLLEDSQINLITYLNGAFVNISNQSKALLNEPATLFKNPFWEAGFGISHPLIPLQLEFTWKLNHTGHNNFVFGINTFIL